MRRPQGFGAFSIIWLGQIVSAVGTRMTAFALGLWVWEESGRVSDVALLSFCSFAATVVFSPIAGPLIDRLNRRLTIVMSDLGSLAATGALLVLFLTTTVHPWMLYATAVVTGAFLAFQYPAYAAAITQMMKRGHFPRANAMMSLVRSLPAVAAPTLAALLLAVTDIKVIVAVDAVSYLFALATVFVVAIPQNERREESAARPSMWRDSLFGFRYILRRPPLVSLLGLSFVVGLTAAVTWTVMIPFILAETGNSSAQAGLVQTVGAVGGVLGGVLVGALGGRDDKMKYVLGGVIGLGLLGRVVFAFGDSVLVWSLSLLVGWGAIPVIDGYTQSIWQEKVDKDAQGRVFAAQQFVENLSMPLALGMSGLLADHFFVPGMKEGGDLTGWFGGLVGTGPGAGMALMCVLGGAVLVLIGLLGYLVPLIRRVEVLMPASEEPAEAMEAA
ncbi:MFS transporter [Streptomyces sp. NPDC001288]|uniref:MFS transporter n=1 Tax=unclassified Streptomyces TaxID=2593676 RepID=UPI00333106D3